MRARPEVRVSLLLVSLSGFLAFANEPVPATPTAVDAAVAPVAAPGAAPAVPVDPAAPATGGAAVDVEALPPEVQAMMAFEAGLTYEHGDVVLGGGKAVLHVPDTFGYLDPAETDRVLQAWGNPPDSQTWGMLLPANTSIFSDESWAVVVTHTDDGHIKDDDAAEIDFTELLGEMQAGAEEESKARIAAGLTGLRIVGWAEPPHYDAATHKIYWAKELSFGDGKSEDGEPQSNGLNYSIRALGRTGVLELNAVANMSQLATIKAPMEQVMGFAEFTAGNRYEDFDESIDRVAEYGIAALVAGGVAAKTGVFKGLFLMLMAGKKFIVIGLIAAAGALKSFFGKKDQA